MLQVFLNSSLRRHMPDYDPDVGIILLDFTGKTACDVLVQLGIDKQEVAFVMVNQIQVDLDHVLRETDQIKFFPPLSGG